MVAGSYGFIIDLVLCVREHGESEYSYASYLDSVEVCLVNTVDRTPLIRSLMGQNKLVV